MRGAGAGFLGWLLALICSSTPPHKGIVASSYIVPLAQLELVTSTLEKVRKEYDVSRVELIIVLMQHPEAPPETPSEDSGSLFSLPLLFEESVDKARADTQTLCRIRTGGVRACKI